MGNLFKRYKNILLILSAIILGIGIGLCHPPALVVDIFSLIGSILSAIINFCVPLIILAFVTQSIISLEKSSGRTLGLTLALSYISMLLAAFLALFVAMQVFAGASGNFPGILIQAEVSPGGFLSRLPKVEFSPLMSVLGAIGLAFLLGLGISATKAQVLKAAVNEFAAIIELLIRKVIIAFLPLFVLSNFVKLSASGRIFTLAATFYKVFIVIIAVNLTFLLVQFLAAGLCTKKNPLHLLKNILPAYLTAFATQSSVASIPANLEGTRKNGVSAAIAKFVIPLCSHYSGGIISVTVGSVAILLASGRAPELSSMVPFVLVLGLIMIATPGVPFGAILVATSLLVSFLAFDPNMLTLAITLHTLQDGLGTAANVCGNSAIAVVVNKFCGPKEENAQKKA